MKISIVIVSLNGAPRIAMPLEALRRSNPAPFEVIVVDNGSTDGLSKIVRKDYPEVVLVRAPRNLGFAGGNNLGIMNASGDVVLLLNDDTEPESGWLGPIERALREHPEVGIAGSQLIYPGGVKIQHLGGMVLENGLTDHLHWGEPAILSDEFRLIECDYATGAAMAIRREVIAEVGMLDMGFWPIYFEEVDFCTRARRAGWKCAVVPSSRVIHHESQTTEKFSKRFLLMYHRNRIRYLIKNRSFGAWGALLRAEARWMFRNTPWDNVWACAYAWAWAPFQAAEVAAARHRGEGT